MCASYCSVADVRRYTSVAATHIGDADITSFITDASAEIDSLCGNPREIQNEIHKVDGKTYRFKLGGRANPRKSVTEITRVYLRKQGVTGSMVETEQEQTYPRDTNEWTSAVTDWAVTGGVTAALDTTSKRCGAASVQLTATTQGTAKYSSNEDLNVPFTEWSYLFFHYKIGTAESITVKVVEDASNYLTYTLTPSYQNKWLWGFKEFSEMTETGSPSTMNYIEFTVPASTVFHVDGLCISDGYAVENEDSGVGYIIFQEEPEAFAVDYFFNPFDPVPTQIKLACANLTASYIFEMLSGKRLKDTAGRIRIDTMDEIRDTFRGLSGQAWRHRQTAMAVIKMYGLDYKTYYVDDEN